MPKLVVETYEGGDDTPAVVHVFEAATRARVLEIAAAHRKTDTFFKASVQGTEFEGISLRNKERWVEDGKADS